MPTYTKDVISGRVTKVTPPAFDVGALNARCALHSREIDQISAHARRLAIAAGFTSEEYRAAKPRTIDVWRNRALDDLLASGATFSDFTADYIRPVS